MAAADQGQRVFRFDELDSTNEQAKRMLAAGEGVAGGDFVVVAGRQTAGKGRAGRPWQMPAGNLACSFVVTPKRPRRPLSDLSFVAAVALRETIAGLTPPQTPVRIKWPNDVLVDGAKISGILLEVSGDAADPSVVVGIGVNVAAAPALEDRATTALAELGSDANCETVLALLRARFGEWRSRWTGEGLAPVRQAWLDHAAGLGQEIVVRTGETSETGVFEALDESGALILGRADGGKRTITAGDVFLV